MAELILRQVTKTYSGDVQAVRGVDLTVEDGELCVIVGPSGCGKSTLLRLVAGLEHLSGGEIHIGDRMVNDLEPAARDIAMVFQNYALYPHMSVFANMAYGLRNRGTPKAEIERRVRDAAQMLELDALLERKPRQLSGGQRQRVAMGRALVREPKAFLFDEPLSNLDAKLRVQMRIEIKALQRKLKTTSLYVTHDQVEAMTLADRLVVMNKGRAEQIGTPLELYERPATRFVAGFIGSPTMNFLEGRIGGDRRSVECAAMTTMALPAPASVPAGCPVTVGIRPEELALTQPERAQLQLRVHLVEALGAEMLVHGRTEDECRLTLKVQGRHGICEGDLLPLAVQARSLHLFAADSGARLPTTQEIAA